MDSFEKNPITLLNTLSLTLQPQILLSKLDKSRAVRVYSK